MRNKGMMFRLQCSTKVKRLFFLRREDMDQDKLASMSKVKKVETKEEKSIQQFCNMAMQGYELDGLEQRASAARNDWMKVGQLSAAKTDFLKTKTSIFDFLCFF